MIEKGVLYLVGTPIGNLGDITLRALEILNRADYIACEDTRRSMGLLNHYDIKKKTFSCHSHNEETAADKIIALLSSGAEVALITDAGMPCISDPGSVVVAKVREAGYKIETAPGPSAVITAMALTGITKKGFCFLGFLPEKKERAKLLEPYKFIDIQLVFYSAPHDVNDDLDSLYNYLGDRKVYVVKELTKIHEKIESGILGDYRVEEPRGEYVIIIEGREREVSYPDDVIEHYRMNLTLESSKKDAIKKTAKERGVAKDVVYKAVMDLD